MHIITRTTLFIILCLPSLLAISQTIRTVKLDSLKISMRSIASHPKMNALPQSDSLYVEPRVEVSAQMMVTGSTNLKTVEIAFEKTQGGKDFKNYSLDYVADAAGGYLSYKGKRFPVVNSVVTISEQVPAVMAKQKFFVSVHAVDKTLNLSNILTRAVN